MRDAVCLGSFPVVGGFPDDLIPPDFSFSIVSESEIKIFSVTTNLTAGGAAIVSRRPTRAGKWLSGRLALDVSSDFVP